jgi:hypothetical protein
VVAVQDQDLTPKKQEPIYLKAPQMEAFTMTLGAILSNVKEKLLP